VARRGMLRCTRSRGLAHLPRRLLSLTQLSLLSRSRRFPEPTMLVP
jgi:hypothetical protein